MYSPFRSPFFNALAEDLVHVFNFSSTHLSSFVSSFILSLLSTILLSLFSPLLFLLYSLISPLPFTPPILSPQQIASIEPLLFKYRVNVAFYGHNHVVQRQSAVFNKTVVQHSVASTDAMVRHYSDSSS